MQSPQKFQDLSLRTGTCELVSMILNDNELPQGQQLSLGTMLLSL